VVDLEQQWQAILMVIGLLMSRMLVAFSVLPLFIGSLLVRLFTTLFLVTGGLLSLISMLFDSYTAWPLSSLTPVVTNPKLVALLLGALSQLLVTALKVAAPFVILMLMIEIAFGMLSRFAPMLNVFFLVLPLKVLALAAMLLLYGMVIASGTSPLALLDFSQVLEAMRGALR
jgi:type III secretory pathway component EscT